MRRRTKRTPPIYLRRKLMSATSMELFLKQNQIKKENIKIPVTKAFQDKDGNPLEWEFRPLTSEENDRIRNQSIVMEQVPGKRNQQRARFNSALYIKKMIATCTVWPDLQNASLQDSYGVNKPEDLVREMIQIPGEYDALAEKLQEYNGYTDIEELVDEAKNS